MIAKPTEGHDARAHTKRMIQSALEAFEGHHVILDDRKNGRWRIARKYDDGKICSDMATEIVSLWGGRIFAGGDIDDCVFGYYSGPVAETEEQAHVSKVLWMGRCEDVGYYVRQKAQIGLCDSGALTSSWESQVAVYELQQMYHERLADAGDDDDTWSATDAEVIEDAIAMAHDAAHEIQVLDHLHTDLSEYFEIVPSHLGKVVSTRVVYAWATIRRLCELLFSPKESDPRGDLK